MLGATVWTKAPICPLTESDRVISRASHDVTMCETEVKSCAVGSKSESLERWKEGMESSRCMRVNKGLRPSVYSSSSSGKIFRSTGSVNMASPSQILYKVKEVSRHGIPSITRPP